MINNLIGQKFHNLTVISKAVSILCRNRLRSAWNCQCECGKTIIVKTYNLKREDVKSCGCLPTHGRKYQPGQKINRLTTVSFKNGKWLCLCECGNYTNVKTGQLTSEKTKSCGCLSREISAQNAYKLTQTINVKYEPKISNARSIWRGYLDKDENCDISFEDFMKLSQKNCFYCGCQPNTKHNHFIHSNPNSWKAGESETFIYNGLDRIDNSRYHTLDNVVPCCPICNRAKINRTIEEFYKWIPQLKVMEFHPLNIPQDIELPKNRSLRASIKCVFKDYNEGGLTINEYYALSQMKCFYCENYPINKFNRARYCKFSSTQAKLDGEYIYNGIDRVDSNSNHNKENIVPCCKYCNFAKRTLTLNEFHKWIERITNYRKDYEI